MDSRRTRFDELIQCVTRLPNGELNQRLKQLNEQKCLRDAELLLYLSEVDKRGLYREEAVSSLFDFCVSRLGYSEDVAWKRVASARLIRQFPLAFELLCTGRIHLSALMLIKPHLTEENHREWMLTASGKSKRQVEKLVASRCPKPEVPTSIRRVPESRPSEGGQNDAIAMPVATATAPAAPQRAATSTTIETPRAEGATPRGTSSEAATHRARGFSSVPGSVPGSHSDARIAPLSGSSYRVTFTASERWKQKLDRARELASHLISPSELSALLERALDLLIEREERRRCAFGVKSRASVNHRPSTDRHADAERHVDAERHADARQQPCQNQNIGNVKEQDPGRVPEFNAGDRSHRGATNGPAQPRKPRSRYVPAAVRREIWQRDEGQCTFADARGNRCAERRFLEIEHLLPFALNGATLASNCTLRCRCHNVLAAEQTFGRRQIDSAMRRARERRIRDLGSAKAE
jgi:hypothetical protein